MKHLLRVILTILFLALTMPSVAKTVTVDEAHRKAVQFLQSAQGAISGNVAVITKGGYSNTMLSDAIILSSDGYAAIYVFNREGGGYVIVSADDATPRQILGWSDRKNCKQHFCIYRYK